MLSDVRALPGVRSAAYTSGLPMTMTGGIMRADIPGREIRRDGRDNVSRRYVTPGFFETLRIPIRAGRDVDEGDTGEAGQVAVVSESFVERYWPGEDALGRVFDAQGQTRTIVGVVGDIKVRGLERRSEPQIYLPAGQIPADELSFYGPKDLVIRADVPAPTLLPAVRRIVGSADPDQPISNVMRMEEIVAGQTAVRRAQLRVLAALAVIAAVLAAVGIHGLLAYTVTQRRQEIGVRLAVGARPRVIARLILREGLILAALGIVPGLIAAYGAGRWMDSLLFGVEPSDPATILGATALCVAMTVAGSFLPARRAAQVSPMSVMRAE